MPSPDDLQKAERGALIFNRLVPAPDHGAGFRRDPETGIVYYSSEWLNDDEREVGKRTMQEIYGGDGGETYGFAISVKRDLPLDEVELVKLVYDLENALERIAKNNGLTLEPLTVTRVST